MSGIVELLRVYCGEFVNAHDPSRCVDLMADGYLLHMAGREIRGRGADYEPSVTELFAQFPDLHVQMHEILTDGDRLATRFTLSGTSTRHGGRAAAWGGVALYDWDGRRLTECWVEEDHHLARVQLRSGDCEHPAQEAVIEDPWVVEATEPADGVLDTAQKWLEAGGDGRLGADPTINRLLASGHRFAFHTSSATVHVSGMAGVAWDGSVHAVNTFSDGREP